MREVWGEEVIRIDLPWAKPPLGGNDRGHTRYSPFTRVKAEAVLAIRAAKVKPVYGPVVITLHWQIPDRIHRDSDNLAPTYKACQDALVAVGVLAADWWQHVPEARMRIHPPTTDRTAAMWLEVSPA